MDPDFGIRTWYLKPTFYLKIVWCLISLAVFIYTCVLLWMTNDPFFPKVVGTKQFTLSVFIFILIIISCLGNVFYHFKILKQFSTKILYGAAITTALSMILGISYAAAFGTEKYEDKTYQKIWTYYIMHPTASEVQWMKKHIEGDDMGAFAKYTDNRCTGAGETLLGLLITWFILQCLLLFVYLQEDEYEDFGNTAPLVPNSGDTYN